MFHEACVKQLQELVLSNHRPSEQKDPWVSTETIASISLAWRSFFTPNSSQLHFPSKVPEGLSHSQFHLLRGHFVLFVYDTNSNSCLV